MEITDYKPKSFWKRPEGITGLLFLAAIVVGGGALLVNGIPAILAFASSTLGLVATILALGAIVYFALDSKTRNLLWYMYKSTMRWITGLFVQIDPISILKSYVDYLNENLKKMKRQIIKIRGQVHRLKEVIQKNKKEIDSNLTQASAAKKNEHQAQVILKSRKAGRLKESNVKLSDLYKKNGNSVQSADENV